MRCVREGMLPVTGPGSGRDGMMLQIRVNGQMKTWQAPLTVGKLLQELGIHPRAVAVERNLHIVPREAFDEEPVVDGDSLEIIRMVGGG